jgi:hypothetical protein
MLLVHHANHLFPAYFERGAGSNGSGRGQTQSSHCREGLFSHKITGGEKRDGGFLPGCGNNRDLRATILKIKNRVCGISLRKEGFLRRQLDDPSSQAGARQEGGGIESGLSSLIIERASIRPRFLDRALLEGCVTTSPSG